MFFNVKTLLNSNRGFTTNSLNHTCAIVSNTTEAATVNNSCAFNFMYSCVDSRISPRKIHVHEISVQFTRFPPQRIVLHRSIHPLLTRSPVKHTTPCIHLNGNYALNTLIHLTSQSTYEYCASLNGEYTFIMQNAKAYRRFMRETPVNPKNNVKSNVKSVTRTEVVYSSGFCHSRGYHNSQEHKVLLMSVLQTTSYCPRYHQYPPQLCILVCHILNGTLN